MATRKKASGPSGKNVQRGVLIREKMKGQIKAWEAAAGKMGLSLSAWIRLTLDRGSGRVE